jgi:PIN domain nuclease of toxin-antitoxin system
MTRVLDTSAVVALILEEPGVEAARAAAMEGAAMSTVNVAESIEILVRRGMPRAQAAEALHDLPFQWRSPGWSEAEDAAALATVKGLSLGDRFCIALGRTLKSSVVTADRAWSQSDLGVSVELIR